MIFNQWILLKECLNAGLEFLVQGIEATLFLEPNSITSHSPGAVWLVGLAIYHKCDNHKNWQVEFKFILIVRMLFSSNEAMVENCAADISRLLQAYWVDLG